MSHPSKTKGYRGEVEALQAVVDLGFTKAERTGSLAYTKAAADLVQPGASGGITFGPPPIRIIATKDDHQPLLFTLTAGDLERVRIAHDLSLVPLVVQVKKRKTTWIGGLFRELKEATP